MIYHPVYKLYGYISDYIFGHDVTTHTPFRDYKIEWIGELTIDTQSYNHDYVQYLKECYDSQSLVNR